MDREDLIDDEHSNGNLARLANRDFVSAQIEAWTRKRETSEIVDALAGVVPVGPRNQAPEIFDDPHVEARQMLVEVPLPVRKKK